MSEKKHASRSSIGKISGIVGLGCNVLLALSKLIIGMLINSMSVIADGINNLSDAASSAVTLIGFKLAEKPADKEHPYGHARFEYLSALTVSFFILLCGFELAKSSVVKIINPQPVSFSGYAVSILIFSILIKAFMMFFYGCMGKKIQSSALFAASADSRNDVISTFAVLVAILAEHINNVRIDGIVGCAVSAFIIYSGVSLAKKTVSPLLGEGANPEMKKELIKYIKLQPLVLGCHDLLLHDYGPGKCYASIHVEMDKKLDAMLCHEAIDKIERDCCNTFGINLVIHHDPVDTDDCQSVNLKSFTESILKVCDSRISIHDFRVVRQSENNVLLVFDMAVPQDIIEKCSGIKQQLENALNFIDENTYEAQITLDLDTDDYIF